MSSEIDSAALEAAFDENVVYFTDKDSPSKVYAEFPAFNGACEFKSIDSEDFRNYLIYRYFSISGTSDIPPLSSGIRERKVIYSYEGINPVGIASRLDGSISEGKIYYALYDDMNRVVRTSAKGVKIIPTSKHVKFLKSPLEKEQVFSEENGDLFTLLRPYFNISDEDFKLFVLHLIQLFSKSTSHFCSIISAPKGCGKTTMSKFMSEIISPSIAGVTVAPENEDDLKTVLGNSYFISFDNTAPLSQSFSNILCSAITGAAEAKRKKFTDSDLVVLKLHNAVVINGIGVVPEKSDLADRSLLFELKPFSTGERRSIKDLEDEFERDKPLILGSIFTTLSKAMELIDSVKTTDLFRMYDANRELLAIGLALGLTEDEVQNFLKKNRDKLEQSYTENNTFVSTIIEYVGNHGNQRGKATDLYQKIKMFYCGSYSTFPKDASHFSRKLNEEKDILCKNGVVFLQEKDSKTGCSMISLISNIPSIKKTPGEMTRRTGMLPTRRSERTHQGLSQNKQDVFMDDLLDDTDDPDESEVKA